MFIFQDQDFQHSNVLGTSSSFLTSHDEIITNTTSKEISAARLFKETRHLHRQIVMGLGFPNQMGTLAAVMTLSIQGHVWPPLRNDPSHQVSPLTQEIPQSALHPVVVSIAVKTWSLPIALHPSVNIHTVQFLSLQGWSSQIGPVHLFLQVSRHRCQLQPWSVLLRAAQYSLPSLSHVISPQAFLNLPQGRNPGLFSARSPHSSLHAPPTLHPVLRKLELENLNSGVNALTLAGGSGMQTAQ